MSNLPTVWSNTLAGMVLGGAEVRLANLSWLALAMSLLYVGGMFLNDAFDREVDARERPERPIPSGLTSALEVFIVGFVLLASGVLTAWRVGGTPAFLATLGLAFMIVLYDVWHKNNALSPVLMGGCRVLVYVSAAVAVTHDVSLAGLARGSLALFAYLMGLTYVAKQENLERVSNMWPVLFLAVPVLLIGKHGASAFVFVLLVGFIVWVTTAVRLLMKGGRGTIPRVVVRLIAGVSLVDALLVAAAGHPLLAGLAIVAFFTTLFFQRFVSGT